MGGAKATQIYELEGLMLYRGQEGGVNAIQRGEWEELRPYRQSDKQTKTDKISRDRSSIGERDQQLEEPGVGAKILQ